MLDFNVALNLLLFLAVLAGAGLVGALVVVLLYGPKIRKLEALIYIDDLTQLFDSAEFRRRLPLEIKRTKETSQPLSLVLLDIDHFKSVNDTYGYRNGDLVLREFATLLKSWIRHTDVVFRYKQGDEFAVLMTDTDTSGAVPVMHNLRKELGDHKFRVTNNREVEENLSLTFSAGIISLDLQADTVETFTERAELALRDAKREVERSRSSLHESSRILGEGVGYPEGGESGTQSGERYRGLAVPLSCSVAPVSEQFIHQRDEVWRQQGGQEGVDQADHQQQLEPVFPEQQPGTLHGQVGLAGVNVQGL